MPGVFASVPSAAAQFKNQGSRCSRAGVRLRAATRDIRRDALNLLFELVSICNADRDKLAKGAVDTHSLWMGGSQESRVFTTTASNHAATFRPTPSVTQRLASEGNRSNHVSTAASTKSKCRTRGATISMFIVHKATKLVGPPGNSWRIGSIMDPAYRRPPERDRCAYLEMGHMY